jgi:ADP-ribosylglycohydrolase/protein-tyrosine phosphatase
MRTKARELDRPIQQCYWVLPGRFLAGEYPRTPDRDGSIVKLKALVAAGVTLFVDLTTDADGLAPYTALLEEVSKGSAQRYALPIPDVGVPASEGLTNAALDLIDSRISAGEAVYIHCWGGIGRTGTIVGCWLARHGHHGDAALARLAELWTSCPKSQRRDSPETEAQRHYIREWQPFKIAIPGTRLDRAQGCMLGQLAGDALGGLVEFQAPAAIRKRYPGGVRELADGGTWNTIAGQPTDDSEMALMLARAIVDAGAHKPEAALKAYQFWLDSNPFDCGGTISAALHGTLNPGSQANGALMRVSPLGIFGARHDIKRVAEWARQDAALTHPNPVCLQANALFAAAIAHAIQTGCRPETLYTSILFWAHEWNVEPALFHAVERAVHAPPDDYVSQMGWVLIAFQNALWQLLHAPSLEEGVSDTVMRGGDTDTNAAICGALLGAVHGRGAVPAQWQDCLLNCRPEAGRSGVQRPRPECFWPVDALELAGRLLEV